MPVVRRRGRLAAAAAPCRRRARPWLNTPRSVRSANGGVGEAHARPSRSADVTAGAASKYWLVVLRLGHGTDSLAAWPKQIRTFGDPVLKSKALPVADVDGKAVRLVDEMFGALYSTDNGLALAAPQIGVQKQVVVWDFGDDPQAIFNPEIVESDGEWVYEEGCLSIPGLYVEMVRPKTVLAAGRRHRRQRRSRARPTRSRPACSSTSSTTSTAC